MFVCAPRPPHRAPRCYPGRRFSGRYLPYPPQPILSRFSRWPLRFHPRPSSAPFNPPTKVSRLATLAPHKTTRTHSACSIGGLAHQQDAASQLHGLGHARRHAPEGARCDYDRVPVGGLACSHRHRRLGEPGLLLTYSRNRCRSEGYDSLWLTLRRAHFPTAPVSVTLQPPEFLLFFERWHLLRM